MEEGDAICVVRVRIVLVPEARSSPARVHHHPPAKQPHEMGRLLAHLHALEVVLELLNAHPDGAAVAKDFGELPLHCALLRRASAEVVAALLAAHPEGAAVADNCGALPLHYAGWGKASPEVMAALLLAHPEGVSVPNEDGVLGTQISFADHSRIIRGPVVFSPGGPLVSGKR